MLIGYFDMNLPSQQLELESNLKSIEVVEKFIEKVKEMHDIPEENFTGIWIAINEAMTNAIKHGNKYDPDKKVSLFFETKDDRYLCFTIKDQGCGFDPEKLPDPTCSDNIEEPNGRGVYLIQKLADHVSFSNNGTTLEMWFDLYKN